MPFGTALRTRLDARDRALFLRCADAVAASRLRRLAWIALTHLGGATSTILLALVPFVLGERWTRIGQQALTTLVLSHVLVQFIKRTVARPRPARDLARGTWVIEPDQFSFPSGHSAAAMSVALAYAFAMPSLAAPILLLAALVGASRVFLGVHYPGDVLMGQLLAVTTYLVFAVHL